MIENHEYYVVDKLAVPTVLLKTLAVKNRLKNHPEMNVSDAVKQEGISRSAFYKYKDMVFEYNALKVTRMVTFFMELSDVAGILSQILKLIASFGANLLTINQNIPVNGKTNVSISIDTSGMDRPVEFLERQLRSLEEIHHFTVIINQ